LSAGSVVVVVLVIVFAVIGNTGTSNRSVKARGYASSFTPDVTVATPTTEPLTTVLPPVPSTSVPTPAVAAAAGATDGECPSLSNVAVSVRPDTALDNLFQTYGDSGRGNTWIAGDGTESVALPGGEELWFFADTSLGRITDGHWYPASSPIIHNSIVIDRDGVLTKTLHKGSRKAPVAFVSPVPRNPMNYGFWPGSMVVNGDTLQVIGLDERITGNWQFSTLGTSLATFELPRLNLLRVQPISTGATDWSGAVLSDGGYTYLYGTAQTNTYVARVAGTDLAVPWSYYDGGGWTADAASAVPIETIGTSSHFSVSKVGSLYVFIAKTSLQTNQITAAFGCSPVGPFGPPEDIYDTPEASQYPPTYGIYSYGAFAHPELSTGPNTLVVSYDVAAAHPQSGSLIDASVGRPRFLYVTVP
jgi:hypothetical protein